MITWKRSKRDRNFWHVGRDRLEIRSRRVQRDQLAAFEVFERFYEIGSHAGLEETCKFISIVVAATHDTSYENDAGGIKASSRWLSEATPPVMIWG